MKTKEFIKAIEKILIGFGDEDVILEKGKIADGDHITFTVKWLFGARLANLEQFLKDKGYIYYIQGTNYIPKTGKPRIALEVVIHKPSN